MKTEQAQVDQWIKQYGVRYFNEMTNTLILMEEMGEFSRLIARLYGEQSIKESENALNIKQQISDELADILFVVICLANQMEINLDEAFEANLIKKTIRDQLRHKNSEKLKN